MNLREEIQLIVARIDEDHINHEDETMLIINKVLDAAENALLDCPSDSHPLDILDAINKLRGE